MEVAVEAEKAAEEVAVEVAVEAEKAAEEEKLLSSAPIAYADAEIPELTEEEMAEFKEETKPSQAAMLDERLNLLDDEISAYSIELERVTELANAEADRQKVMRKELTALAKNVREESDPEKKSILSTWRDNMYSQLSALEQKLVLLKSKVLVLKNDIKNRQDEMERIERAEKEAKQRKAAADERERGIPPLFLSNDAEEAAI